MLQLWFEGYFQMRMATDPDPTDDPRGKAKPDLKHKIEEKTNKLGPD
jgi:hypothetical protein